MHRSENTVNKYCTANPALSYFDNIFNYIWDTSHSKNHFLHFN